MKRGIPIGLVAGALLSATVGMTGAAPATQEGCYIGGTATVPSNGVG